MIQRIQSLWLLFAVIASLASLKISFFSGMDRDNLYKSVNGMSHFLLMLLTVAVGLLSLITIFLFKNRKLQKQLTLAGILLQAGVLAFYFYLFSGYKEGSLSLTSVLSLLVPLFQILTLRGLHKDEQLIRSMDRLR